MPEEILSALLLRGREHSDEKQSTRENRPERARKQQLDNSLPELHDGRSRVQVGLFGDGSVSPLELDAVFCEGEKSSIDGNSMLRMGHSRRFSPDSLPVFQVLLQDDQGRSQEKE